MRVVNARTPQQRVQGLLDDHTARHVQERAGLRQGGSQGGKFSLTGLHHLADQPGQQLRMLALCGAQIGENHPFTGQLGGELRLGSAARQQHQPSGLAVTGHWSHDLFRDGGQVQIGVGAGNGELIGRQTCQVGAPPGLLLRGWHGSGLIDLPGRGAESLQLR